jgi:hypothetical protein
LVALVLEPPGPFWPGAGLAESPSCMLGFLKYSKIAARCCGSAVATSHITRKNAIMAVTKSA